MLTLCLALPVLVLILSVLEETKHLCHSGEAGIPVQCLELGKQAKL